MISPWFESFGLDSHTKNLKIMLPAGLMQSERDLVTQEYFAICVFPQSFVAEEIEEASTNNKQKTVGYQVL